MHSIDHLAYHEVVLDDETTRTTGCLGRNALLLISHGTTIEASPTLELQKCDDGASCEDCPDLNGDKAPSSSDCPHFEKGNPPTCKNQNSLSRQVQRWLGGGGSATPEK